MPFTVRFTGESLGPEPELVFGTVAGNLNAGFVPSPVCPGAFDYAITLTQLAPTTIAMFRVAADVTFNNSFMPGAAFAEGPVIRSV